MAKSWTIPALLLLCAVTASVKANAENATEHHQPTTTSNHTGSGPHPAQNSTAEPQAQQNEDDSGESEEVSLPHANSTHVNATNVNLYNNTYRPNFRRYVDLKRNIPIVEKQADGAWIRLRPPLVDGEQQEVNVTRYAYFPNGSRVALRTKFDYSYDDVNWFRSSRIKIPVSTLENGTTIYQYRFGPKRWIGANRNLAFRPNANQYNFNEEGTFFKPPPGLAVTGNGTAYSRKQFYRYGPMAGRNFGLGRFGRRSYNRFDYRPQFNPYDGRKWIQRPGYPDYYGQRPAYPYPRYVYNDPYYHDGRYRQGDAEYYDRRYRPVGPYDDPRHVVPGGTYDDKRYYAGPDYGDGRYRSDGYQSVRGYEDKRYADGAYDERKYPPQAAAPYNEPTYRTYDTRGQSDRTYDTRGQSDRTYDTRGQSDRAYDTRSQSDRTYDTRSQAERAPNYDARRYDQGYGDSYDRRDRHSSRDRD